jgi:hypothetical protein
LADTTTYSEFLDPKYTDFTVTRSETADLSDTLLNAGATGRLVSFELNCVNFWKNIKNSAGAIAYQNIPKVELSLTFSSFSAHTKSCITIDMNEKPYIILPRILYLASDTVITQLESFNNTSSIGMPDSVWISISKRDVVLPLQLGSYFLSILNNPKYRKEPLPASIYVYTGIQNGYFTEVSWKKTQKLPMNYLFTNPQ